jgi:hypothetical protein
MYASSDAEILPITVVVGNTTLPVNVGELINALSSNSLARDFMFASASALESGDIFAVVAPGKTGDKDAL